MLKYTRATLEETSNNAYSKLIDQAAHVYIETRICAFNPFDAGWSDSFFKRVTDISSEIAKAVAECSRPIENRIDMSQSVPFKLSENPCVEYYFAHDALVLVLIRYIFVFRYVPTQVAGGVLYRRDYVAVQNNIRGESNLPLGPRNLGSCFIVIDTWGTDFMPKCTFDTFSPCAFFGIPENHRHSELHLGNYATAISKGRGSYVFFDNDVIKPSDFIDFYYDSKIALKNEYIPPKAKEGEVGKWKVTGINSNLLMSTLGYDAGVNFIVSCSYDVTVSIAYGLKPLEDAGRWFYCQRCQTTLDKDSLDGSDSGAAVERSTHWYAFNDGRIYSPSDLEPLAESCARNFSKKSIFDGKEPKDVRLMVANIITCPKGSSSNYDSFDFSQDGRTYTSDTIGVPADIVVGAHQWHVLDYDADRLFNLTENQKDDGQVEIVYTRKDLSEVPEERKFIIKDSLTISFEVRLSKDLVSKITKDEKSDNIIYPTGSAIRTYSSVTTDSGRIKFNNFELLGGVNLYWTRIPDHTHYDPNLRVSPEYVKSSPETHGDFSVEVGTTLLTIDGVSLPISNIEFASGKSYNTDEMRMRADLLKTVSELTWPCSVKARTVNEVIPYWLVRLPYSTISKDLKRNANFKLSGIDNVSDVNLNYTQSLITVKPSGLINVVRKDMSTR